MKIFKRILIGVLIILIVIQFFRPDKNNTTQPQPKAIALLYDVPSDVKSILHKACNDCHSNNTRYPWYAEVQPFAWWLEGHIADGKHDLNFDEFATYRLRKQYHRMEDVEELVENGAMPLSSYTWVHTDARLTPDEKQKLINWAISIRDTMKTKYHIDSLIRKK